jgi:hypothetical protein
VRGWLHDLDCDIAERGGGRVLNGMYDGGSGKAHLAIANTRGRTLAVLLFVYELAIAQKYAQVIVPVMMHQRGLLWFNRDVIYAHEHVVDYVVMMRFRAHVNRLLLGKARKPGDQEGSK